MKENNTPVTIRRADYRPPAFWIDSISLNVELDESSTVVSNTMVLRRNSDSEEAGLKLDGVELELLSVAVNGNTVNASCWSVSDEHLLLEDLPNQCQLTVVTRIYPDSNTALEGLYRSSGIYCTQCEAEGFRKITYYLDRPDVLARFTVRIEADKLDYPVLLSNGNNTGNGELPSGRHFAEWSDPFPKPSYLFALVAGKLEALRDSFVTNSGRQVELVIHVESHNLHKCAYAMEALKRSMRWDEQVYGLEYDLDIFMIVAVDDFNMGAMENKGLNIFNSKFVLADQASATDADFMGVEAVIAHEYFHNWTGNRVTCRDWFQLSLKEGLTVFRDQQFSSDMNSRAVKRIEDVRLLRMRQFPEDAGPMAHPIRPDEYMEINNFYTATVYEKGAEVIRMMHTLVGEAGFRRGMDLYFERFDGQAVTCDDFVQAMQGANQDAVSLDQFRRWYSQAGTPVLAVVSRYDQQNNEFHLWIKQSCPATPGQTTKLPFHIPLKLALIGPGGKAQALRCTADTGETSGNGEPEMTLHVTEAESHFIFSAVASQPVASLLRDFSAPVILEVDYSDSELAFLMANDTDEFNRWEAGQRLYKRVIEALAAPVPASLTDPSFDDFNHAFEQLLSTPGQDPALLAAALTIPGIEEVAESHEVIAVDALFNAICSLKKGLAEKHRDRLLQLSMITPVGGTGQGNQPAGFSVDSNAIGQRSLRQACLSLIGYLSPVVWKDPVWSLFETANNMTDKVTALRVLCNADIPERGIALQAFYDQWSSDRLVIDKWFTLQAVSERSDTIEQVRELTAHQAFELGNPNRVRSLIGAFALSNPVRFHSLDGQGYRLLADYVIKLDQSNPQIAARLVGPLGRWRKMDTERQGLMQVELSRIAATTPISPDVYEIVQKSLG